MLNGRSGKEIGLIVEMFEKLENGKEMVFHRRNGVTVYELTRFDGGFIRLSHYGTNTLLYHVESKSICEFYGESNSDRDSMNTLLSCLNHDKREFFRFGRSIGFILETPSNDDLTPNSEYNEQLSE